MARDVLFTQSAQPFIIAGSGTLGWDQVASNLVEPGENALVLHSGYFGDSLADCLETYGAKVTQIKAPIGSAVHIDELKAALKERKYKIVTVTHVDTSTGVLSDVRAVARAVQDVSPDTLVIVDGVCSVASEEIKFDEWGLDVVLTASQKGLGTPPGLSLLVASQRAMKVFERRVSPVTSYYASWKRWLPIMKAYEAGTAAYFATPPVNLIFAFHTSLKQITCSSLSVDDRIRLHREASHRVKEAATNLGLKQLATDAAYAANGMTALYFPDGVTAPQVLPQLLKENIIVAGGLHKEIKDKYFRIGHMGITAVDSSRGDVDKIIAALNKIIPAVKRATETQ
ncbi:putative AGX1-alanine-glyoxylate transaminase [Serendipita vermifera]|nr:putative AGX1-alanine-glyoxylate transaminase [Serendipita vermifera]